MNSKAEKLRKTYIASLMVMCFLSALISRFLFDYTLGILCISMMYLASRGRDGIRWNNLFISTGFNWIWPAWIAAIAFSNYVNNYWNLKSFDGLMQFRWILGSFFFARAILYVGLSKEVMRRLLYAAGAVCLLLLIFFYPWSDVFKNSFSESRFSGVFRNPNDFSHAYSLVFAFAVALFWQDNSIGRKKFYLQFSVMAMAIAIFFTYSRIAWFATFLIFLLSLGMLNKKRAVSYFFVLFGIFSMMYVGNILGVRDRSNYIAVTENGSMREGRINIWKGNLEIFKDNPIWGVGYFRNVEVLPEYYKKIGLSENSALVDHAHNQYLQWLASTGIVGLFIYLYIFISFFKNSCLRNLGDATELDWLCRPFFASLFTFLVLGLADSNFEISSAQAMLIMLFGLGIFLSHQAKMIRLKRELP